jgi:F420-non-reducing hydrogenase iron-sulfur subunit
MVHEPNIVVFACNWCSYAGADLAGVSRMQYPPTVRIIRVMCSGRFDPDFALRAFQKGADGVLVLGCHPGDCHYVEGNLKAEVKTNMTAKLLDALGIDPARFRLEWVSAGEGSRFAGIVKEFTDTLKKLGPTPLLIAHQQQAASAASSEQEETGGS